MLRASAAKTAPTKIQPANALPENQRIKNQTKHSSGGGLYIHKPPPLEVSAVNFRRSALLRSALLFFGRIAEAAVQQLLQLRVEVHVVQADFVHTRIVCGEVFQLGGGG